MKVYYELDLAGFDAWGCAESTLSELTSDEVDKLQVFLDEEYKEMDETDLNDLLAYEKDFVARIIGYSSWEALCNCHNYGDKVNVYIFNIEWDKEDEDFDAELPTEVSKIFDYNGDNSDLEEEISEWLSYEYEYCHDGFKYEIKE